MDEKGRRAMLSRCLFLCLATLFAMTSRAADNDNEDPYLWLEDVTGKAPLAWVEEQNARSLPVLEKSADYGPIYDRLLAFNNSSERIAMPAQMGRYIYNFWRDQKNVRGLWRRTTPAEFRRPEPNWETVLDLDQLAEQEKENWVWKAATCRYPDYSRCLLSLSRGGADATVVREFDTQAKRFVDGGFALPEAKSSVAWRNRDSIYVATDFGPDSMTSSGYPRLIKEWRRGTPLGEAKPVFEGDASDVSATPFIVRNARYTHELVHRRLGFFTSENFLRRRGKLVRLDLPADASPGFFNNRLLVRLRSDWAVAGHIYPSGTLLAIVVDAFLQGKRDFDVLYQPGPRQSLAGYSSTRNALLLSELDNVKSRLYELALNHGKWTRRPVAVPEAGSAAVASSDVDSDDYFVSYTDFLTPSSLLVAKVGEERPAQVKSLPPFFDASGLAVSQLEATSEDGTLVPYFVVQRKDASLQGNTPTLLYGYGGFEIAMRPGYSVNMGVGWLEQGGVYVLANIRGGGEFGPRWHQAALKEKRHKAFEDFIAVAEDLIARKITTPKHLGIMGGSNGGLLVAAVMTQRPELFGAVVCQVPLLDMKRYHKLLAGASWMAEYGDPDKPDEWAYIQTYSPYQKVAKDKHYPPMFFITSTRDDRVHPGHARKMVAKMLEQGHDVLYFENTEGGHGAAANNQQQARMWALSFAFLLKTLR